MSARGGAATQRRLGADRWHFQHGPIDLIIDVDADDAVREAAIEACFRQFQDVLPSLVAELSLLKQPAHRHAGVSGPVARRMLIACAPFAQERFLTPMAAVAGSVADHLRGAFERPGVRRASINNGGDIALWLNAGMQYRVGIWSQVERRVVPSESSPLDALFTIDHASPVRGIATSGWRGRSQSLGIADSVTVLAHSGAAADAAATLIGNAVNCNAPGIVREPAAQVKDDSDLGARLVTVDVPPLPATAIAIALAHGRTEAQRWVDRGLVYGAALFLQGRCEIVTPAAAVATPPAARAVAAA
jgi:ApbE superfamily uncharacterized protein (UPF0280 family)